MKLMFNDWKQAMTLSRLELSLGPLHFLVAVIASAFIALFLSTTIHTYIENVTTIFDIIFIGIFSVLPSLFKPNHTQYQKVKDDLWASHIFMMHKQLAIKESILIKSRFIIHFAYTLPILTFVLLFTFPFIKDVMSLGEYMVFAIIWLSFSIYIGLIMAVSDAGDYVNVKTMIISIIKIAVFLAFFLFIFHRVLHVGIIEATIMLAQEHQFSAIIVSLLLAFFSIKYWEILMKKVIQKIDYF